MLTSVFVYGTLRPGQVNFPLVQRAVSAHMPARLHGHALRAALAARFPYATEGPGLSVVGSLLVLRPSAAPAALARLDALEGYRAESLQTSHYLRVTRQVVTETRSDLGQPGTAVTAWVYLAGSSIPVNHLPLVVDGDWLTRVGPTP